MARNRPRRARTVPLHDVQVSQVPSPRQVRERVCVSVRQAAPYETRSRVWTWKQVVKSEEPVQSLQTPSPSASRSRVRSCGRKVPCYYSPSIQPSIQLSV